jgi:hypothetical protein
VIHTAYNHDFTVAREVAAEADVRVIEAMGEVLVGSDRPLVITSGTGGTSEDDPGTSSPRYASEAMALSFAQRGVRAVVVRFPPTVHGRGDHGFVPILINIARAKGVSAYPGDGSNHWAAVHRLDAAHLFRLAVDSAMPGMRLHGVAEEGIARSPKSSGGTSTCQWSRSRLSRRRPYSASWGNSSHGTSSDRAPRPGRQWVGSRSSQDSSPTLRRATTSRRP